MNTIVARTIVCGALLAIAHQADAQIVKVSTREALKANTTIEWFEFGADGAGLSTPVIEQLGTLQVSVASSSGELNIAREGTSWKGDFIPGQYVLYQPFVSDSFIVAFSPPVSAVGTQIDPGNDHIGNTPFTGSFVARMCLYAANDTLLGMVQTNGTATASENNAAKFLGARSAGTPIGFVVLQVSGVTSGFPIGGNLGINRMDVVAPLPSSRAVTPDMSKKLPACGS